MVKYLTLLLLISLRFVDKEPNTVAPGPDDLHRQKTPGNAELMSFTGMIKENKIVLQWIIDKNESVDRFEIEKSADKRNFNLVALVFCSEKTETDHYKYMDKLTGKKTFYRIKIINKDGSIKYSSSLEMDPGTRPEPLEQTKTNSYAYYC